MQFYQVQVIVHTSHSYTEYVPSWLSSAIYLPNSSFPSNVTAPKIIFRQSEAETGLKSLSALYSALRICADILRSLYFVFDDYVTMGSSHLERFFGKALLA